MAAVYTFCIAAERGIWYDVVCLVHRFFRFYFTSIRSSAGSSPAPSVQTDRLGIAVRRRGGGSRVTGLGVTATTVYTVRTATGVSVRICWGRVPRRLDYLVRGRRTVFALFQCHDELRDLDEDAYQGQADALEGKYVAYKGHHGADHHFYVAQAHVHHFHFVLVAAAATSFFTPTCKNVNGGS